MFVRKLHPWNGKSYSGNPRGSILKVKELKDHAPCDGGPKTSKSIAVFEDGSWEFIWNLKIIQE